MNFDKVNIYNNLINLARNKKLFINFTKKGYFFRQNSDISVSSWFFFKELQIKKY